MCIYLSTMGYLRSLPTKLTRELVEMNKNNAPLEEVAKKQFAYKVEKNGLISGNYENDYVNAGLSVSLVNKIKTVKEIIDELMADFVESE